MVWYSHLLKNFPQLLCSNYHTTAFISHCGSAGKESACRIPRFNPWVGKIPWRRERLPTPVFWPRESHGLYSPWGCKELDTTERLSHMHGSKVMLKILQARLQQLVNRELPDVQARFRKGSGTRDQISNICWIIKKAWEFQKNICFCFTDCAKAFNCVDHNKMWKILQKMAIPDHLTCLLIICM